MTNSKFKKIILITALVGGIFYSAPVWGGDCSAGEYENGPFCSTKLFPNEPCTFNAQCLSDACVANLEYFSFKFKNPDSTPTGMLAPAINGKCMNQVDLFCPSNLKVCLLKQPIGQPCIDNFGCKSNYCGTGQGDEKKCMDPISNEGYLKFTPTAPKLEVDVPTLQPFTTKGMEKPDADGNIYIPFIGQYIVGIYKWAMLMAGIVATVMIILGGFTYLTSGGDASRAGEGKERIGAAIFGLILLLGSYMLLYLLNPDLVQFKSLKINVIKQIELDIVKAGSDNGAAADGVSASCLTETEAGMIPTEIAKDGNRSIHKDMILPLQKATELAQKNGKILQITIYGGVRTMAEQEKKWQEALARYGSEDAARKKVAKPSCNAPHLTGRAIDICFKNNPICGKITGESADFSNDDVILLQSIMKEAGFKRYCAEWWHFEYNLSALSNRCSP